MDKLEEKNCLCLMLLDVVNKMLINKILVSANNSELKRV